MNALRRQRIRDRLALDDTSADVLNYKNQIAALSVATGLLGQRMDAAEATIAALQASVTGLIGQHDSLVAHKASGTWTTVLAGTAISFDAGTGEATLNYAGRIQGIVIADMGLAPSLLKIVLEGQDIGQGTITGVGWQMRVAVSGCSTGHKMSASGTFSNGWLMAMRLA